MTENKRYEYWEDSDTAYDTKIKYGQYFRIIDKKDMVYLLNEKEETIQLLKKELFESEKDYIMETYSDNPIRRDEKIQLLKEEFKARFGDVE